MEHCKKALSVIHPNPFNGQLSRSKVPESGSPSTLVKTGGGCELVYKSLTGTRLRLDAVPQQQPPTDALVM